MKKRIETSIIVIHCTANEDHTMQELYDLHTSPTSKMIQWGEFKTTGKGFDDIGYHFVIEKDGALRIGRKVSLIGAHCFNHNHNSVGVCLVGNHKFTEAQFREANNLIKSLLSFYHLDWKDVYPHWALSEKGKTCPNFDLKEITKYNSL